MEGIKLVQLNIERNKHLERVIPFLAQEAPDVVCLQELLQRDLPLFEQELGMHGIVGAMQLDLRVAVPHDPQPIVGIAILSKLPLKDTAANYYFKREGVELPTFVKADTESNNKVLLRADIEKDGETYRIATTHFTWTQDGQPDRLQRRDIGNLLRILAQEGEFVLTGDFNAPRGGEIFLQLASAYKDNIPPEYTTSIDGNLHRAGAIPFVVDGLFTTPVYEAKNVSLKCSVSDHCSVVATIVKRENTSQKYE